ncbi:hydroxyacid dehydrogenase [Agrobacterium rubi]|uniref:hydroxyacid dehydrogenase n=1 Tax=Agrobacterium rubi TaxID=28099 RepID=UPI001572C8D1|nr:hydroxyacid dehydrogenase [Agrobacterium rubi]NTF08916.1 hydroxyacid dehydrogenase [Agrobacterium rubi]NTF21187.1 hydroxyacid dehydrogenase [Agrobacterium rubi]NTF28044.1 hydroxyacid dehydrogenase [Agrobacterium rubi]
MTVIFVSSPVHPAAIADAEKLGQVLLAYGPNAVRYYDVKDDVTAVLLRSGAFTDAMMAKSPKLRIIARHGVGTDTVDIAAATRRGIWVTNTPGGNSRAVAEHVFALAFQLARKLGQASGQTRHGLWAQNRADLNGIELGGRTLGLLGQGNIGTIVADLAQAFGMDVIVTDPWLDQAMPHIVPYEELLARADILSLHLPLTDYTRGIVDSDAIARMKTGAILINTSRGGLIDEDALAEALRSGKLGGAGLDVLDAENTDMVSPMLHNRLPIADLPNLIVTPHIAGQTEEALLNVGKAAVRDIAAVLNSNRPAYPVNQPAGVG